MSAQPVFKCVNIWGSHDCRAVADGPVGPAMAGPIIDPVILILNFFFLIFFPTGPIIEPVILIFAICVNTDSP